MGAVVAVAASASIAVPCMNSVIAILSLDESPLHVNLYPIHSLKTNVFVMEHLESKNV